MNQNLQSLSHGDLTWHDSLPPAFKGVRLPGSIISTSVGAFGSICIQEFTADNFSIRFNVFDLLQEFVINLFYKQTGLFSRIIVKGKVDIELSGHPRQTIQQNQFVLLQQNSFDTKETYHNNIHISFETFLSTSSSQKITDLFPGVDLFSLVPKRTDAESLDIINSILQNKYDSKLHRHFFESRIKDLVFKYLVLATTAPADNNDATGNELESIYKAEELIAHDLEVHYSIPELAKEVHLNEFRFKLLFKRIFGVGPYEFLIRKRLQKAKQLLEEGLSVKEAAARVGYRPSDFTTAFRNHFGFAPSSIKKKNY